LTSSSVGNEEKGRTRAEPNVKVGDGHSRSIVSSIHSLRLNSALVRRVYVNHARNYQPIHGTDSFLSGAASAH